MALRTSMKKTPTIPPNTTDKASMSGTLGEDLTTEAEPKEITLCPLSID